VGVDVTVLHALENDLWDEMNAAVKDIIPDFSMVFGESDVSFRSPDHIAWECQR
jgi:hypothetical protein